MTETSLRDRILGAKDIEDELVPVPEWGVEVEVRTITLGERNKVTTQAKNADGERDGAKLYALLIVAATFDPTTGQKVFKAADVADLEKKSGAATDRIAKVALRLSGLAPKEEEGSLSEQAEAAGKDSSSPKDQSAGSGS